MRERQQTLRRYDASGMCSMRPRRSGSGWGWHSIRWTAIVEDTLTERVVVLFICGWLLGVLRRWVSISILLSSMEGLMLAHSFFGSMWRQSSTRLLMLITCRVSHAPIWRQADDVWCATSCKWILFGFLQFPEPNKHASIVHSQFDVNLRLNVANQWPTVVRTEWRNRKTALPNSFASLS